MPPAKATAEAPTSEERVATTAVADEPAEASEQAFEPAAEATEYTMAGIVQAIRQWKS